MFFSENGHVSYQIKDIDMYYNMQAIILSLESPSTPGVGSKDQNNFLSGIGHVAYQIKENDTHNNMQAIILSYMQPRPRGWRQNISLSKSNHVAYRTK